MKSNIYLNNLQKTIEDYFVEALIYLKLPLISLNIRIYDKEEIPFSGEYQIIHKNIILNLVKNNDHFDHYCRIKEMSNEDFYIFTIFHEIAHYFHDYWHHNHWNLFLKAYSAHMFPDEAYNKQNIEKHANNIAKVLYKRLYKDY